MVTWGPFLSLLPTTRELYTLLVAVSLLVWSDSRLYLIRLNGLISISGLRGLMGSANSSSSVACVSCRGGLPACMLLLLPLFLTMASSDATPPDPDPDEVPVTRRPDDRGRPAAVVPELPGVK